MNGIAASLAFFLTVLLVPVVIRMCERWQLFDRPGPLKIHARPVPRLGGVALVLAISASIFAAAPHDAIRAWPFFAALALVWLPGFVDDLRGLSAPLRLAAQIAAGIVLWRAGWAVPVPTNGMISALATCLALTAFVNSFNFLDGADGLAAGVAGIIATAYAVAPLLFVSPFAVVVACGIAAACGGFLIFNYPPATVFCGDSGSTALGLSIAFLALDFWRSNSVTPSRIIFPLLVAALPLLDATFAVIRRLVAGGVPWRGDRCHLYDLLRAAGWVPRRVALTFYTVTAALAAIALWGLRQESVGFWLAAVLSVCVLVVLGVRLGVLRKRGETSAPQNMSRVMKKETAGSS